MTGMIAANVLAVPASAKAGFNAQPFTELIMFACALLGTHDRGGSFLSVKGRLFALHGADSDIHSRFCNQQATSLPSHCNQRLYGLQALGSSGYVDFVISSSTASWAVELLRDGSAAGAHAQRFAETGIYAPMMDSMDAHCLIDFRGPNTRSIPTIARQNFWYVSFDEGLKYACFTAPGDGQPERFPIHMQS